MPKNVLSTLLKELRTVLCLEFNVDLRTLWKLSYNVTATRCIVLCEFRKGLKWLIVQHSRNFSYVVNVRNMIVVFSETCVIFDHPWELLSANGPITEWSPNFQEILC